MAGHGNTQWPVALVVFLGRRERGLTGLTGTNEIEENRKRKIAKGSSVREEQQPDYITVLDWSRG